MRGTLTTAAFASVLVLGAFIGSPIVFAQDSNVQPCVGETCPPKSKMQDVPDQGTMKKKAPSQGEQMQGEDQSSDQVIPRKKKKVQSTQSTDVDVDVNVGTQKTVRQTEWRFNPNKHQRRRSKNVTFRFYFDGWWYPRPYWEVYGFAPYRISCGEGRAIVSLRYNRVRVVECRGGIYTYLGRRYGDTWRVLVNSRTGRIVGRAVI